MLQMEHTRLQTKLKFEVLAPVVMKSYNILERDAVQSVENHQQ
jgi:hypothetical protein